MGGYEDPKTPHLSPFSLPLSIGVLEEPLVGGDGWGAMGWGAIKTQRPPFVLSLYPLGSIESHWVRINRVGGYEDPKTPIHPLSPSLYPLGSIESHWVRVSRVGGNGVGGYKDPKTPPPDPLFVSKPAAGPPGHIPAEGQSRELCWAGVTAAAPLQARGHRRPQPTEGAANPPKIRSPELGPARQHPARTRTRTPLLSTESLTFMCR